MKEIFKVNWNNFFELKQKKENLNENEKMKNSQEVWKNDGKNIFKKFVNTLNSEKVFFSEYL